MKLSTSGAIPVYTIAGAATARPLPEWLARKRRRSLKRDPEFANRIELLQDFEFEEASSCIRVSEDGDWALSTGTYKPQMHAHYLPHLSLSYARHTNCLNQTFILLSTDYSKSLHLQTDRFLEFHTPGGLHYSTRIPRYGRDLKYSKSHTEALIPAVGLGADGHGEVFRLNLERGQFLKGYEIDLDHDRLTTTDDTLQGGIDAEAVNAAAVAEQSHNMLAFGTSLGTVEFWDPRSRSRIGQLDISSQNRAYGSAHAARQEISVLEFKPAGLHFALGTSTGGINMYDLRSPVPLLRKEQGYDFPIQNIQFLESESAPDKVMTADKRIIKIWDAQTGDAWASVEPAVDLNHVEWVPKSGMFLTANEGRQQHAFLIPQLGAAPRWCAFLDNLVEEMAEDVDDPSAFGSNKVDSAGAVYDNYKFLTTPQLGELGLAHLIGQTSLLRPYMHGYFVAQKLYEQARLISNPDLFVQQREKSIQERIAKERESRVRGNKAVKVKVNRKLAEKMLAKEEANEQRKARRALKQAGLGDEVVEPTEQAVLENEVDTEAPIPAGRGVLSDTRFTKLFEDKDFEIDETSREFALQNPSTIVTADKSDTKERKRALTAAEEEERDAMNGTHSSSDEDASDSEDAEDIAARTRQRQRQQPNGTSNKLSTSDYRKSGHKSQSEREPQMVVSSSSHATGKANKFKKATQTFGSLARNLPASNGRSSVGSNAAVGEKQVTFAPERPQPRNRKMQHNDDADDDAHDSGRKQMRGKFDRRSASGNAFRRM